jgi:WD40 repeat protein
MSEAADDNEPDESHTEQLLSNLADSPEGQRLARMFGMPVTPAREDLSAFGRWKLRFRWEKSGLKAGLFLNDMRLFLFSGDEWHAYHFHGNRVEEAIWVDTKVDHDRRAKWIAAKGSIRAYPEDDANISICEFVFEGDEVDVRILHMLDGHTVPAIAGSFDVNSERLASADSAGEVILWDSASGTALGRMHSVIERISSISYYPNPAVDRLIVNNQNGEFEVLDFQTNTSLGHSRLLVKGRGANVWHSADLKYIVAADEFGRQEIVSAESLEAIEKSQWFGIFLSNCVSDGQRVNAIKNATGQVWLFEREGVEGDYTSIDVVPPGDGKVTSMAISADGTVFATVFDKQELRVWERLPNAV